MSGLQNPSGGGYQQKISSKFLLPSSHAYSFESAAYKAMILAADLSTKEIY